MSERGRSYAEKDVLITGGAGFIGQRLVRRLAGDGARVVVLGRGAASIAGADWVCGDVRDDSAVSALISRRFDHIFHLAAYSGQAPVFADHEQSLTTNCLGLLNVLDAVRRLSPETVICFPSSRLVYGRTQSLPVSEGHPTAPLSLYGIHKRTGEEYCAYYGARWGLRTVALRLSNPYGPHSVATHNRYNIANWMIDGLLRGEQVSIFGRGEQLRDYIYVDDAVEAMAAAAADPRAHGGIYNIGSGAGLALVDFVRMAIAAAGSGSLRFEPWPVEFLQVETGDYAADISKIRDELGWAPRVSLRTGIARTIAAQRRSLRIWRKTAAPGMLASNEDGSADLEAAA